MSGKCQDSSDTLKYLQHNDLNPVSEVSEESNVYFDSPPNSINTKQPDALEKYMPDTSDTSDTFKDINPQNNSPANTAPTPSTLFDNGSSAPVPHPHQENGSSPEEDESWGKFDRGGG